MKKLKISMLGAGSGFVVSVAKELAEYELFNGCEFVLMDIAKTAPRMKAMILWPFRRYAWTPA